MTLQQAQATLNEIENREDSIRFLNEAVKAKSSNLRMTSSDIRLLFSLVEQRLRLGEVQNPNSSNLSTTQLPPEIPNSQQPESIAEIQAAIDLPEPKPAEASKQTEQKPQASFVVEELNGDEASIESFLNGGDGSQGEENG